MKEDEPQHAHYLGEHKTDADISRLAEKLAPPEEVYPSPDGKVRSRTDDNSLLEAGSFQAPKGFVESEEDKRTIFGLEPVILVILLLMSAFIAFIAYLIYITPTPN